MHLQRQKALCSFSDRICGTSTTQYHRNKGGDYIKSGNRKIWGKMWCHGKFRKKKGTSTAYGWYSNNFFAFMDSSNKEKEKKK